MRKFNYQVSLPQRQGAGLEHLLEINAREPGGDAAEHQAADPEQVAVLAVKCTVVYVLQLTDLHENYSHRQGHDGTVLNE